jgi:transcription antitermination factor NusG
MGEEMVQEPWALLQLNPQIQDHYVNHVGEHNPEISLYFPVYTRICRPAKKRHPIEVISPVYPGYVFARIRTWESDYRAIVGTPYRVWFVRFGKNIALVRQSVIDKLTTLESRNELVVEVRKRNPYQPGVRVVVHLPVASILATIVRVQGQMARVEGPLGPMSVRLSTVSLSGQGGVG